MFPVNKGANRDGRDVFRLSAMGSKKAVTACHWFFRIFPVP
jgi:hypothetical protein